MFLWDVEGGLPGGAEGCGSLEEAVEDGMGVACILGSAAGGVDGFQLGGGDTVGVESKGEGGHLDNISAR